MIEFEYWWLLAIPLFFGLGWWAARLDLKHLLHESRTVPRAYFQGLNFLVNEQPDRAIDALLEVAQLDPETIELHFALGNLFRRRGETDRAIRIHQNLIARHDLDANQRQHAGYELGLDFLKAGMLDRAEQNLLTLVESDYAQPALEALLDIYQREHDWRKAVHIAQRLHLEHGTEHHRELAHFYCELAQEAMQEKNWQSAHEALQSAMNAQRGHVRAALLLGELALQEDSTEQGKRHAIEHWLRVGQQQPTYLPLVATRLNQLFDALGRSAEAQARLREFLARQPSHDVLCALYDNVRKTTGPQAALELLQQQLVHTPTLLTLDQLLKVETEIGQAQPVAHRPAMQDLVHTQARRLERYTCRQCGFKAREFYWQCPGCAGWDTYAPQRQEELEWLQQQS